MNGKLQKIIEHSTDNIVSSDTNNKKIDDLRFNSGLMDLLNTDYSELDLNEDELEEFKEEEYNNMLFNIENSKVTAPDDVLIFDIPSHTADENFSDENKGKTWDLGCKHKSNEHCHTTYIKCTFKRDNKSCIFWYCQDFSSKVLKLSKEEIARIKKPNEPWICPRCIFN